MTPSTTLTKQRWFRFLKPEPPVRLLNDFCYNSRSHRSAAFTDCKTKALFHGDVGNEFDRHGIHVVARHDHFHTAGKLNDAGHVRCPEVELRTVPIQERGMA